MAAFQQVAFAHFRAKLVSDYDDAVSLACRQASAASFVMSVRFPTRADLQSIRRLHRDRTSEEIGEFTEDLDALSRLVERIQTGEVSLEQIPANKRGLIRRLIKQ